MTDTTEKKQGKHLFQKGESGNLKGRPKGTKNKLSEEFIHALAADFNRYGLYPIARVRRKDPAAYLKVIASLIPKEHKVDGTITHQHTHEAISETAQWIEGMLGGDTESETKEPSTH